MFLNVFFLEQSTFKDFVLEQIIIKEMRSFPTLVDPETFETIYFYILSNQNISKSGIRIGIIISVTDSYRKV